MKEDCRQIKSLTSDLIQIGFKYGKFCAGRFSLSKSLNIKNIPNNAPVISFLKYYFTKKKYFFPKLPKKEASLFVFV